MPDNAQPSPPPAPPSPRPEPNCALLALCLECGQGIELPLPIDPRTLAFFLAQLGWFVAVLSPPNQGPEAPMILGPLCATCAQQIYTPEALAAAKQRQQQLLQAAAQPSQVPR